MGGHSPATHFATKDQFLSSLGINPALPNFDVQKVAAIDPKNSKASGLLRPVGVQAKVTNMVDGPMWMKPNPKTSDIYLYGSAGSVYTVTTFELSNAAQSATVLSAAQDINTSGQAGRGCEYYDNYMYFATPTDIARYGPLNGVPTWVSNYWTGTLGKGALNNMPYPHPGNYLSGIAYPNHVIHRHSDGKLYILDVDGNNKGTVHFIATTKTTVEGDTDNGSTANKLTFGYGLWPTAIESYGSQLVIALYEGSGSDTFQGSKQKPAKIAFWDTTSANFNQITWVEFPDSIITAFKNINGILYAFSGNSFGLIGFRITKYIGGNTFDEVNYIEDAIYSPYAGAVEGDSKRLLAGVIMLSPEFGASVISIGLQKASLSGGLFNVMRATDGGANITSILLIQSSIGLLPGFSSNSPVIGWVKSGAGSIDGEDTNFLSGSIYQIWWSQIYKIGQKFKITKIRIPLAQAIAANMIVTPTIYVDEGTTSYVGGTDPGLAIINNTNYPGAKNVVMRPVGLTGEHNFWLELKWKGSALCTVGLPITIEYELLDD